VGRHTAAVEMAYSVRKCNWRAAEFRVPETKDRVPATSGDKTETAGRAFQARLANPKGSRHG